MAEKNNKNMIIGIAAAVIAVIVIVVGVIIAKNNSGNNANDGNGETEQTGKVDKADFSDVDVSVGYGDYDTMFAQAKAIQNGEMTGKVIQIDGVVSHPMSKYSVGEEDESGKFIGTEFVIEGTDESEYPEDGMHVIVTGQVIEKEPLYFVIKTTPEYVEILEDVESDVTGGEEVEIETIEDETIEE